MSKLQTLIKEKQSRFKQNGVKEVFKKEDGAIDLSSIMVGVIVIGLIGGVIAATVFAVIPWAQDNAAKQQLDSIVQAENAYFGLSAANPSPLPAGTPANSFGKSAELKTANLLTDHPRYCVTTPDDKKSYTGYSQSGSGTVFTVTDKNSKPEPFAIPGGSTATDALPADCQFITVGFDSKPAPVVPYVDPTPKKFILTYQCDVTTANVRGPISSGTGNYSWNDGTTSTTSNSPSPKTLAAGTKYTFIFEGTLNALDSNYAFAGTDCIRSVDHWGTATGTFSANRAFYGAVNLTKVPANIPSTITDMRSMFYGATSFNDSNVKNWDVSKATNMSYMFYGATSFNQDLSGWNTGLVADMSYMFNGASSMNGNLNGWNTSKVTTMDHMFYGASSFNQPLNNWNTTNVTNMMLMFYGAPYSQDLTSWDMNKVNRMAFMMNDPDSPLLARTTHPNMFRLTYQCDVTTASVRGPISSGTGNYSWSDGITSTSPSPKTLAAGTKYTFIFEGTLNALDSNYAFAGTDCIRSVDHWGTATGTFSAYRAFYGAVNLTKVPTNIPSTITDMRSMFYGATNLNDPNIKTWDVSKATNMSAMFYGATSFNQDLSGWNTGLVADMSYMFNGATAMNSGLNGWNTSKVTTMDHMFYGASSFNQPLNNWNTTNVTNMMLMFYGAPYSQDLTNWDMNKVNKMAFMMNDPDSPLLARTTHPNMFRLTYQCNVTTASVRGPISSGTGYYSWSDGITSTSPSPKTLAAGTKYTFIFEGTLNALDSNYAFAGTDCIRSVDHWGTATGTFSANRAFYGAVNLTKVPANIPSTITDMRSMFYGATSFNDSNVKNWDVSKATNMSYMFYGATSFNQDLSGWNTGLVADMSYMFNGASSMNGNLNGWNTSKVTNMDHMFYGASSFNQPLNNWNTTNVTNMMLMFYGVPYSQDLTNWDMNKVNKMAFMMNDPDSPLLARTTHPNMFRLTYQCNVTTASVRGPISSGTGYYSWSDGTTSTSPSPKTLAAGTKYTFIFEGTLNALDSNYAFAGTDCIRSIDHWGTATGTFSAYRAFYGAVNLTKVPANIPSTITDMRSMFYGATSFNDSNVKNWDVSKATNMSYMFSGATSFNQDLSGWNTAAVTNGTFFAPASFPDAYMPAKTSK